MPPTPDKLAQVRELLAAGRLEAAKSQLQRVLRQLPRDPHANNLLSAILTREGQHQSALYYAQKACESVPDHPSLLQTLGNLQALTGSREDGMRTLRRAISLSPGDPELRLSLAKVMMASGELRAGLVECETAAREGVASPDLSQLHAGLLAGLGRVDEAIDVLERAATHWPQHPQLLSHRACLMNYSSRAASEVLEAHRAYGQVLVANLPPLPPPPSPRDPEKKLRVGFVSSDLRQHSILYFLEPVLEHLDRTQFEIACYHTCLEEDAVSRRLRGKCALWRHEPRTAPTPLASLIRDDAVDVLIELSGHTDGHRLAAVHMRPAPVQMTWLGYPNTTGVAAVDARIVDSITDPAELGADGLATERLLRLDPCFVCYRPPADAPSVETRSATEPIVFGCFGAMQKVGEACLALWADALAAVPGSRLLLKNRAMNESAPREVILSQLAARGIGPDRMEMRAWTGEINEHLRAYSEVDIALDTAPYNGTTTTCEALYMGVPVITLAGGVHASRVSASLLNATGMGALVARDPAHFAAIAAATASDRAALAALRSGLRSRVLASPLCDERAYAARFGALLRAAWRERCAAG